MFFCYLLIELSESLEFQKSAYLGGPESEAALDRGHATAKFDVVTGEQKKGAAGPPSYTAVFAKALIAEAEGVEEVEIRLPADSDASEYHAGTETSLTISIADWNAVRRRLVLEAQ